MECPRSDNCFLCNEEIDFFAADSYELTVSFAELLPRGASRPSALRWAHEHCVVDAAHPSYDMSPLPSSTDQ
jgi:hypothetical protein